MRSRARASPCVPYDVLRRTVAGSPPLRLLPFHGDPSLPQRLASRLGAAGAPDLFRPAVAFSPTGRRARRSPLAENRSATAAPLELIELAILAISSCGLAPACAGGKAEALRLANGSGMNCSACRVRSDGLHCPHSTALREICA